MKLIQNKFIQNKLVQGTFLLTIAGFITRIIGFIYRIFLSDVLGAKLLGVYQLVFPVYGLCFTIYAAGIQTAISQLIASSVDRPDCKRKRDLSILKCGMAASVTLALLLTVILYRYAGPVSRFLLLEPACAPYIKIMCILFLPCGITSCINGYFYGKNDAKVPAMTQIIEQLARVTSVVVLCLLLSASSEAGCRLAVLGLVIGESCSCLYNCFRLWGDIHPKQPSFTQGGCPSPNNANAKLFRTLLFLAFTLTITKLILSTLHSAESVFIPAALKDFGCTEQEALSIYGVLSGIAMPFILFPSTVTNSFAVMLLPAIAHAEAKKEKTPFKNM
ncbi:MAG: oligosaccharide flippase family protein [Clostridiaceae bacterium]|nr:oligosaccharide flippase family protein [Clostridiaceae bacterium]